MDHLHATHQRFPRHSDFVKLAGLDGPVLSIFMNTHSHGVASARDGARLGRLLKGIDGQLLDAGHERRWIKSFLDPIEMMSGDDRFWQHQRSALAVFRNEHGSTVFQFDGSIDESIHLGASAQVLPLIGHLRPIPPFLLLVLSKNEVQLFACDDARAEHVVDDAIPRSFDEALRFEDPEAQLQFRSQGGVTIGHGHGIGDEVDKERLERFLLAVDRAIVGWEGNPARPLVIAAVDHNVARYRQISAYPALFPSHISGNPDRIPVGTLHHEAVALMTGQAESMRAAEVERISALVGTGRLETVADAIAAAARAGRVEKLYLTQPVADDTTLNDAIVATLRSGGEVANSPHPLLGGANVFAVTRW